MGSWEISRDETYNPEWEVRELAGMEKTIHECLEVVYKGHTIRSEKWGISRNGEYIPVWDARELTAMGKQSMNALRLFIKRKQ